MEFLDIVAGLWGFVAVFTIYIVIYSFINFVKRKIKKSYAEKM